MLNEVPIGFLIVALLFLIVCSAFFSSSETGIFSLNRYRLRHLAKKEKHRGAQRALALMQRPDRLIGTILLGNNFVNILASALATVLFTRLYGDAGIWIATATLTIVILLFAEVAPKTMAALHPERIAFPASYLLGPLQRLLYPLVWSLNVVVNNLLRLIGVKVEHGQGHHLSSEELRTVVNEAGVMIPQRHQQMLLGILDLERVTIEDIMIPRNEIIAIDLDDEWDDIVRQLTASQHTRLPIFRSNIDHIVGIVHMRNVLSLLRKGKLDRERFMDIIRDPYFIPEGTPLNTQLLNFQQQRRRIGLVVDEYGDIQGLVTLDDILEEIVGEFTTDPSTNSKDIHPQEDGSFLIDGSVNVRELNRVMGWNLPISGAKTLNGLILEYLENIPEPGTSLLLSGYPLEVVKSSSSAVKIVRIDPAYVTEPPQPEADSE